MQEAFEEEDEELEPGEESYDELLGRLLDERMEEARANPESLISGEETIKYLRANFGSTKHEKI